MNSNQSRQMGDKCRLCLASEGSLTTCFDDEGFRKKLDAVCNYTFATGDDLPSQVCRQCTSKITEMHEFLKNVRCNQEILLSTRNAVFVKIETPPKNEIYIESTYEVEMKPTIKQENVSEDEQMGESFAITGLREDPEDSNDSESPLESSNKDDLIKQYFNLSCDVCSAVFDTYAQLSQHSKKSHNRKATLQCCNKTFQIRYKMLRHINTHLRPYKCDVCGKTFTEQHVLQVHKVSKHLSSKDKPFKCEKCPQSFEKEHKLRSHWKRHDRVDCSICKKNFSNVYAMRNHMKIYHSENQPKFICDVCGKEFKSFKEVEAHRVTHTAPTLEDGVRCEICHTWISRKNRLRRHMSEIHQSKQSECDICHKLYPNLKALKKHRSSVHIELNFKCDVCGKRFKKALNLKEHQASAHTGQKLYSCEFCGAEMNSNGNLYSHKKNKHPQEWKEAKEKSARFI